MPHSSVRKNILASQQGGLTILFALMLTTFIGFIGLGVEVSLWYSRKVDIQSAVDAAAIAAAYQVGTGASLSTIANNEMTRNGFGTSNGVTITVNNPPASGAYTSNNDAVEVIAQQNQNPLFSGIFGRGTVDVAVRAVAVNSPAGGGCIMSLNPSQGYSITVDGSINMPGCSIIDNSNNSSAFAINGGATVTVGNIYTAGGIMNDGTIKNSSANVTGGSVVADPYSSLPMPSVGSCANNNFTANGTTTMSPGVYCNGIILNSGANVTMNPGVYIVNGSNFNINSNATLTGSGVTIVFTNNAVINVDSNSTVNVSAPTSGTYAGIAFYANRTSSNNYNNFNGGSNMLISGMIYMPSESINFDSSVGGTAACTKIIAYGITINGGANISSTCPSGYSAIPIPGTGSGVSLVE